MYVLRQLRSFLLPVGAAGLIPFLLVARYKPVSIRYVAILPAAQLVLGAVFSAAGLLLLIVTIRLIIRIGKGTLAPWDPTRKLVLQGPYRYTRNPMISGVALLLLGESILLGSWVLLCWFAFFVIVNTIYLKVSEEPGLARRFGREYLTYREAVPMWMPRLRPWTSDDAKQGKPNG
jgi:protein-S-isoprenylcysteine O-methyltransferase Ste14